MKSKFPIVKNLKIFGVISALLCITGLVSLILLPFGTNLYNLAIDFAGGTQIEFNMHTEVTADVANEIAALVEEQTGVKPEAPVATGSDKDHVMIRSTSLDTEQREAVITAMQEKYNLTDDDLEKSEDVSASIGNDLKRTAFTSAAIAVVLMLIYITFRFEFTSGLAAVCCLIHDLLVMLSVYVIFQIPLNQNFIAAALTILGYSINASIIVFDRVRENMRTARKESFEETAEKSIWQTMGRTINTTLTTLFTVGMIFILGVSSLRDFTLPLL
ncbi:MAG: protein translocase subunit SecF, partial [Butyricicoccus sp.]